ncbi:MAG: UvrB/UvrC motif-containing protein [Planctomycetota bacterium]
MGKPCQVCNKREAKIHCTEIKDGKKTELHLCETCAHEKNVVLAFPSFLSQIVKGAEAAWSESEAVPASCPQCGLGYADFKAKGRMGCPRCYDVFSPVLAPLLEKVHGKRAHTGKAPERFREEIQSRREIQALERELRRAISAEDYEQAARLRDRIQALRDGDLDLAGGPEDRS